MQGTLTIARFAGIPVRLHWTFSLLFVWFAWVGYKEGMDGRGIAMFLLIVLFLSVCVVMHEYGHALTARYFGVTTRDIILMPLGGLARLNGIPDKPVQEMLIALAGPAVNVLLAIILGALILFSPSFSFLIDEDISVAITRFRNFIPLLFLMNITLAIFNMIPAFPMDGGRVLRAVLSLWKSRLTATRIASIVGQVIAFAFVALGAYTGGAVIMLIGVFVFFAARWEYRALRAQSRARQLGVRSVMRKVFSPLNVNDRMEQAAIAYHERNESGFLIFNDDGKLLGVLPLFFVKDAENNGKLDRYVSQYMSPRFEYISPELSLSAAGALMREKGYPVLPVVENGEIVGVLDTELVNEAWKV